MSYKDPLKQRAAVRAVWDRKKAMIDKAKSIPCSDCGGTFPPECMDFDHLENKYKKVSSIRNRKVATILDEIAKCEVVCANCHRIRTKKRLLVKYAS